MGDGQGRDSQIRDAVPHFLFPDPALSAPFFLYQEPLQLPACCFLPRHGNSSFLPSSHFPHLGARASRPWSLPSLALSHYPCEHSFNNALLGLGGPNSQYNASLGNLGNAGFPAKNKLVQGLLRLLPSPRKRLTLRLFTGGEELLHVLRQHVHFQVYGLAGNGLLQVGAAECMRRDPEFQQGAVQIGNRQ